jgi:hypothetical protein
MKKMKLNYELIKEQRDHLLGHVWHDTKRPPQPIDEEVAWGIIDLLDSLINEVEDVENVVYK